MYPLAHQFLFGSLVLLGIGCPPLSAGDAGKEVKSEPRLKVYGWIDSGITFNSDSPADRQNFGHLFTDRANELMLNQAVITFERALKPEACAWDWGFKAQFMMGSDARFVHYLGEFDNTINGIIQPDVVELYANVHAPVLTEKGVDLKVGQFVTLAGAETIDPRTNFFYSHTWMFNFGIPFKHTGMMVTTHATSWLDVTTGFVRGINTGFDDNNDTGAFHGALTFNLLDGKLAIAAVTHLGAENDAVNEPLFDTNSELRQIHDIVVTWKPNDKLTAITDLNGGVTVLL